MRDPGNEVVRDPPFPFTETYTKLTEWLENREVYVEGLPLISTTESEVREYFEQNFGVTKIAIGFKAVQECNNHLFCWVLFSSQAEYEWVLKEKEPKATFHGCPLYFHRLVWKK